jgi:hypothetical protein
MDDTISSPRARPQMHYASPQQIARLVAWTRDGAASMDHPDRTDYLRRGFLNTVGSLIHMWRLGPEAESLRRAVHNRNLSEMSEGLRLDLVRHARLRALVTPGGGEAVPLTGMQLEILVRLSWGSTLSDTAEAMELGGVRSVSNNLYRARSLTGTLTTSELLSCAYRNLWLPTAPELLELMETGHQTDLFDGDREYRFRGVGA